ncbi:MAG: hypothetical protein ACRD2D_11890, partial [Terriglobales bacterium]
MTTAAVNVGGECATAYGPRASSPGFVARGGDPSRPTSRLRLSQAALRHAGTVITFAVCWPVRLFLGGQKMYRRTWVTLIGVLALAGASLAAQQIN